MKRKVVSKLMVNWVASFVSVILLLSMMALPALAVLAANTVNSASIINGQVRTPDLAGDAVTSAKIKNGQVKRADIALGAVVSGRIADNAVTTAKIRNGHVRSADIALGAVLSGRIANNAITSAKIRNGTITNADIAPGLNADKVDGKHASVFVENTGPQTIDGTVTAKGFSYDTTKTGYLSISPTALSAEEDGEDYFKRHYLQLNTGSGFFDAPVQLPDGAVITKMTFYFLDNIAGYTEAILSRTEHSNNAVSRMANPDASSDSSSWQTLVDSSINNARIDNNEYAYHVEVFLSVPSTFLKAGGIVIEYDYTTPGS